MYYININYMQRVAFHRETKGECIYNATYDSRSGKRVLTFYNFLDYSGKVDKKREIFMEDICDFLCFAALYNDKLASFTAT